MSNVEVVLPVLNEAKVLEASLRTLHSFLRSQADHDYRITIADNGSTDGTLVIARRLASELPDVGVFHVDQAGRGRALTQAWLASDADVLAYIDIDLSTGLEAFPWLVESVASGLSDVSAGSRLGRGAQTQRSVKREVLSRGYVLLIEAMFGAGLRDTQCGF